MTHPAVKKILEDYLAAMTPAIETAYANGNHTPTVNVAFQRVHLLPSNPDNPSLGAKLYRDRGVFHIALCYPLGQGTGDADARAFAVQQHFQRGSLTADGITVSIPNTPAIGSGFQDKDRWVVPVSVPYGANIFI